MDTFLSLVRPKYSCSTISKDPLARMPSVARSLFWPAPTLISRRHCLAFSQSSYLLSSKGGWSDICEHTAVGGTMGPFPCDASRLGGGIASSLTGMCGVLCRRSGSLDARARPCVIRGMMPLNDVLKTLTMAPNLGTTSLVTIL